MIEALKELDVPGLGLRDRQLSERGIGIDESFARDAQILVDGGYRPGTVIPVDQFLWSSHIELVAYFSRV